MAHRRLSPIWWSTIDWSSHFRISITKSVQPRTGVPRFSTSFFFFKNEKLERATHWACGRRRRRGRRCRGGATEASRRRPATAPSTAPATGRKRPWPFCIENKKNQKENKRTTSIPSSFQQRPTTDQYGISLLMNRIFNNDPMKPAKIWWFFFPNFHL